MKVYVLKGYISFMHPKRTFLLHKSSAKNSSLVTWVPQILRDTEKCLRMVTTYTT